MPRQSPTLMPAQAVLLDKVRTSSGSRCSNLAPRVLARRSPDVFGAPIHRVQIGQLSHRLWQLVERGQVTLEATLRHPGAASAGLVLQPNSRFSDSEGKRETPFQILALTAVAPALFFPIS
ncbi:unnamed protein product [Prorocentrum cordatum]|uniref:Uncharacterized protein n=1 Tax=Prorocentrum cordatum TaxID=2364126 RepID=A0ABN9V2K2_9DINO|nr:unnamed protein product [Polarella glacialis]